MNLLQVLDISWCTGTEIEVIQNIVATIILVIQIAIPILLVIFGMIDLGKAIIASKEDDIKKAQGIFVKRLISAVLVFLVIFIVKIVISLVAHTITETDSTSKLDIWNCADCFVSGPESAGCKPSS